MMAGIFMSAIFGGPSYISSFFLLAFLLSKFIMGEENEDGTETIGTKKFGYDLFEGPWGRVAFFSALAVVLVVLCGIFVWKGFFEPSEEPKGQPSTSTSTGGTTNGASGAQSGSGETNNLDGRYSDPKMVNKIAVIVLVAVFFILAILMSADSYGLYKRPLTPNQVTCLFFAYVGVVIVIIIMTCAILVVAGISKIWDTLKYAIPTGVIVILVIYALCNGIVDLNELSVYLRATPEDPDAGKDVRPPNA